MKTANLVLNRRGSSRVLAKEITLHETQSLRVILLRMLVVVACISLAIYILTLQIRVDNLEERNTILINEKFDLQRQLNQADADYNITIGKLATNIIKSNDVIDQLDTQLTSLMKDNRDLAAQYDELFEKYSVLAEREELYNKYEYIVMYDGKRTDVTYEQIKSGEQIMLENGYNPNILFSTIMVESRGVETAKNKESTATGYGQILASTGKYIYEDLMGNPKGTYKHSMAKDGDLNMQMTATYIDHLLDINNAKLLNAMRTYSGRNTSGTRRYISMMSGFSDDINKVKVPSSLTEN